MRLIGISLLEGHPQGSEGMDFSLLGTYFRWGSLSSLPVLRWFLCGYSFTHWDYLLRFPPPHSPTEIWGSKTLPPIVPTTQHSQQVGPTLAHNAEASMKTHIPKIYFLSGVRLT